MNGLLLATHADKLFDRHLMSFRVDHKGIYCTINKKIRGAVRRLGLEEGMELDIALLGLDQERKLKAYLSEHLKKFDLREIQS